MKCPNCGSEKITLIQKKKRNYYLPINFSAIVLLIFLSSFISNAIAYAQAGKYVLIAEIIIVIIDIAANILLAVTDKPKIKVICMDCEYSEDYDQ